MKNSHIILIFISWLLYACSNGVQIAKSDVINFSEEPSYEAYQAFLDNQIKLFRNNNFDDIILNNTYGNRFNFPESPTYFHYVFNAVKPLHEGSYQVAEGIIDNFNLMVLIDTGLVQCDDNENIILANGTKVRNSVVFNEMCHEAFLGYYGKPNELLLSEITKYTKISDEIVNLIKEQTSEK